MTLLRRLEQLEDAMQRKGGDTGYKLVVTNEGEMPEKAVTREGLTNWPADRIIFISFVTADQKLP